MADFVPCYSTARMANEGKDIYDLELEAKYQSEDIKHKVTEVLTYTYPPYSLGFYYPFLQLSLDEAYHVWMWINVVCTIGLLALLYVAGICTKPLSILTAAGLFIVSFSWIVSITNGQPMMVVLLGLFAGTLLAQREKFVLSAIAIIATSFKPPIVIVAILYLIIIHGKSLFLKMGLVSFAIIIICMLIFGENIWLNYIHLLLTAPYSLHDFEPSHLIMGNMRALLLLVFGAENLGIINKMSILLWIIAGVMSVLIAIKSRNASQEKQELGFSLSVVLSCVFSPFMFVNSLILLTIPIAYLLKYSDKIAIYTVAIALVVLSYISFNHPELNPPFWVSAQLCLLAWIAYWFINKKHPLITIH